MCIIEELKGMGIDERVSIAMITICPSTGDVVYDEFEGPTSIHCALIYSAFIQLCIRYSHAH